MEVRLVHIRHRSLAIAEGIGRCGTVGPLVEIAYNIRRRPLGVHYGYLWLKSGWIGWGAEQWLARAIDGLTHMVGRKTTITEIARRLFWAM
jgi:hypothetical protein